MNIIRTAAVELEIIPAVAYKTKLASGGSGLRILRLDQDATGVFTVERRNGSATPYGSVDLALFPEEAIDEALDLTSGLPYSARGKIKVRVFSTEDEKDTEDVTEDAAADLVDMVDSDEYNAVVDRYSDEKGKLNYKLMNKDFIQFASRSKTVQSMVESRAEEEGILIFILKSRAAMLSGSKDSLPDDQITLLIETLDEIDPRGAFKELKSYIRRLLGKNVGRHTGLRGSN